MDVPNNLPIYINNGVFVILTVNIDNINRIRKLLETDISAYPLNADKKCTSLEMDNIDDDELVELFFDVKREQTLFNNDYIKYVLFMIPIFDTFNHTEKHDQSYIYKEIKHSPANLVTNIKNATKKLVDAGIQESDIKFGFLF